MITERETNRSDTVLLDKTTEVSLSDEALNQVVGGLNPQPLPPGYKAYEGSPKFSWGIS
jgi:hypothetical protein